MNNNISYKQLIASYELQHINDTIEDLGIGLGAGGNSNDNSISAEHGRVLDNLIKNNLYRVHKKVNGKSSDKQYVQYIAKSKSKKITRYIYDPISTCSSNKDADEAVSSSFENQYKRIQNNIELKLAALKQEKAKEVAVMESNSATSKHISIPIIPTVHWDDVTTIYPEKRRSQGPGRPEGGKKRRGSVSESCNSSFYYDGTRDKYVSSECPDVESEQEDSESDSEVNSDEDVGSSEENQSFGARRLGVGSYKPGPSFIGYVTTPNHGIITEDTKGLLDSFDVSVQPHPTLLPSKNRSNQSGSVNYGHKMKTSSDASETDANSINFGRNDLYCVTTDLQNMITAFRDHQKELETAATTDAAAPTTNNLQLSTLTKEQRSILDQVKKIRRLRGVGLQFDVGASEEVEFKRKYGTKAYNHYVQVLNHQEQLQKEKMANKNTNTKTTAAAAATKEKLTKGVIHDFGMNADYFNKHIAPINTLYKRPYCDGFTIPSTQVGTVPASVGISAHLPLATSHRNTKPDLTAMELRFFHRPRLPMHLYTRNWVLTMPIAHSTNSHSGIGSSKKEITGGAVNDTAAAASANSTGGTTVFTTIDKNDISLITGSFVVIEYIEENPPIRLNPGMSSSIVNYFRPEYEYTDQSNGADGDASNRNLQRGREQQQNAVTSDIYKLPHRIPRHLIQLLKKRHLINQSVLGDSISMADREDGDIALPLGEMKKLSSGNITIPANTETNGVFDLLLPPQEHVQRAGSMQATDVTTTALSWIEERTDQSVVGPFLGAIQNGEVQQSIRNSLFKAPLYAHHSTTNDSAYGTGLSNDFLMIRTKLTSSSCYYHLRELPIGACGDTGGFFVCGQTEPMAAVPKPTTKTIAETQKKFFRLAIARYLQTNSYGIGLSELQDSVLRFSKKKVHYCDGHFKAIIRMVGDEIQNIKDNSRDSRDVHYTTRGEAVQGSVKWYPMSRTADLIRYSPHMIPVPVAAPSQRGKKRTVDPKNAGPVQHPWIAPDTKAYLMDELEKDITPEQVCLQESCNNGEYILGEMGITENLNVVVVQQYLVVLNEFKVKKEEMIALYINHEVELQDDLVMYKKHTFVSHNKEHVLDLAKKEKQLSNIHKLIFLLIRDVRRLERKMMIGRFISEKLLNTPWNLTEAYIYGHRDYDDNSNRIQLGTYGLGSGNASTRSKSRGVGGQTAASNSVTTPLGSATLKRIELFGVGDPSGIGEGYAFVRVPILDRVSKSSQKVKKSYYNTDADIRLLHIKDAVDIIVTHGVQRSKAVKLPRWDVIRLVEEIATRAYIEGIGNKELLQYARNVDDIEFGSGAERNSSNVDLGIKEEMIYRCKCDDIWAKQARGLTVSSEEELNELEDDAFFDMEELDGEISKKKMKGAASAAFDMEKFTGAKTEWEAYDVVYRKAEAAAKEHQRNSSKQASMDKSQMGSFWSILDGRGSNAKTAGGGSNKVKVVMNGHAGGTVNNSRLGGNGGGNGIHRPVGDSNPLGLGDEYTPEEWEQPKFIPPQRVVKRITRTMNSDGHEKIEIRYVLQESEVMRVSEETRKSSFAMEATATRHRKYTNAMTPVRARGAISKSELPRSAGGCCADLSSSYGGLATINMAAPHPTGSGSSGDSSTADAPRGGEKMQDFRLNLNKLKSKTNGVDSDSAELVPAKYASTTQRTPAHTMGYTKNKRNPALELACKLEESLMLIWNKPTCFAFKFPVDPRVVLGYSRIKYPMCLMDIRNRIGSLYYHTLQDYIDDLYLVQGNCTLFNGVNHELTKNITKLVKIVVDYVHIEKKNFGHKVNVYNQLEEAIQYKYTHLHKEIHANTSDYKHIVALLAPPVDPGSMKKKGSEALIDTSRSFATASSSDNANTGTDSRVVDGDVAPVVLMEAVVDEGEEDDEEGEDSDEGEAEEDENEGEEDVDEEAVDAEIMEEEDKVAAQEEEVNVEGSMEPFFEAPTDADTDDQVVMPGHEFDHNLASGTNMYGFDDNYPNSDPNVNSNGDAGEIDYGAFEEYPMLESDEET